jgi:hypothetical protein
MYYLVAYGLAVLVFAAGWIACALLSVGRD